MGKTHGAFKSINEDETKALTREGLPWMLGLRLLPNNAPMARAPFLLGKMQWQPILRVVTFAACLEQGGFAWAQPTAITSDTSAQFYDVRSPSGLVVLPRRRVTTTFAVATANLLDEPASASMRRPAPQVYFRARLRYDVDAGIRNGEREEDSPKTLVPSTLQEPVDLMYAYLEGHRFARGTLGFRLGRQYVTDPLGFYSFDGAWVRFGPVAQFSTEAYLGLEQRGGLPLSTSRWEADGVWRGRPTDLDQNLYGVYGPAGLAPVYGAAVDASPVPLTHARLSYRHVDNTGPGSSLFIVEGIEPPGRFDKPRTSQERLGVSIDGTLPRVGSVRGLIVHDFLLKRMMNVQGTVDAFLSQKVTLSGFYDRFQPSFDGDSVFNFFATEPSDDIGFRGVWNASDQWTFSGGGNLRIFRQGVVTSAAKGRSMPFEESNAVASSRFTFNQGGHALLRYRFGDGSVSLRGLSNWGDQGERHGGELGGHRTLDGRILLDGRASLWHWSDTLRPDRDATSMSYVASLGYLFSSRARGTVEWEHSINRLVGQRFRTMVWLSVPVTP